MIDDLEVYPDIRLIWVQKVKGQGHAAGKCLTLCPQRHRSLFTFTRWRCEHILPYVANSFYGSQRTLSPWTHPVYLSHLRTCWTVLRMDVDISIFWFHDPRVFGSRQLLGRSGGVSHRKPGCYAPCRSLRSSSLPQPTSPSAGNKFVH